MNTHESSVIPGKLAVEADQVFRLLVSSVHDYAIFMLDAGGHVATWNPGAQQIKQYETEEILGKHFSIFYPPEDVKAGKCEYELEVAARTGRFEDEGWRVRKDGSRFWANVVISAVRDGADNLVGFAKVTRDLTERRNAELERLRLARAQESVRLRDEFISIASHELRTPLNTVQLQVSSILRLLRSPEPVKLERLTGRIQGVDRQLQRMSGLIGELLDVSRAAAGKLSIEPQQIDVAAVVRDVLERMREDLLEANCPLAVYIDAPLVGFWDPVRLDQIVTNLLSNAMKYGRGAPVEVMVSRQGERVWLRVRDHGIGIAPEHQAHIFQRFARVAGEHHYEGAGLGLWIVKQLVDAMGGAITVESTPGHGASFTVDLPLHPPPKAHVTEDLEES